MLKREYLRTTGVQMCLKNNLSSECVNLDSEFTLQTMDSRLLSKLAQSADASEESTSWGISNKGLDVRTEWGVPPPQGRRRSSHDGAGGLH